MKYFIYTSLFFLAFYANSNDFIKEWSTTSSSKTVIESFNLYKEGKFSSFNSEGAWTNNFGNYGRNICMGIVRFLPDGDIELNNMCEGQDKNGYKTWSLYKRSGPLDSGIGSYEIVDTTLPNRELFIGLKCTYAIRYMDEINFVKSKCKISEAMEKVLQNVANE